MPRFRFKISQPSRRELSIYALFIALLHVLGFVLLVSSNLGWSALATGILAYTLGLRHAFDVDHIAAIDNTVRRLITPAPNRPARSALGTGFYFSLGHSTVVFGLSCAVAFASVWALQNWDGWAETGGVIGLAVSGIFLLLIGLLNVGLLWQSWRSYQHAKQDRSIPQPSAPQGFLTRLLGPLFRRVSHSWQLYPLGFLFGLGFDTATEIALLGMAATSAVQGISWPALLALPILFAAGMSLLDSANGVFMVRAYKKTLNDPRKRAFYNLLMTGISVLAAVIFGLIQLAGLGVGWFDGVDFELFGWILVASLITVWIIFSLRRKESS
jgi:high-affinity nickel-transport protein